LPIEEWLSDERVDWKATMQDLNSDFKLLQKDLSSVTDIICNDAELLQEDMNEISASKQPELIEE